MRRRAFARRDTPRLQRHPIHHVTAQPGDVTADGPSRYRPRHEGLVAELRAQGIDRTARRVEDWPRVGLIPRVAGVRSDVAGDTEVVYPAHLAERCRRVAQRMRRGQPWLVVALSLFGASAELPEETVRAAYRWALTRWTPPSAALPVALDGGRAAAERWSSSHGSDPGAAAGEPPSAVAVSLLTNLLLVQLGDVVADDVAMIELLASIGLPGDRASA